MVSPDSRPAAGREPRPDEETLSFRRLARLGIDVGQLASEPLPDGMWPLIERVVRRIRGKRRRWYAAAAMYGRVLSILEAGGTVDELKEQFGDAKTLAPLMANPVIRESVFASVLPSPLQRRFTDVLGQTKLRESETLAVAAELIDRNRADLAAGKTPAEILQAQEPPRVVARRLRRSRIWQRPWWWHVFHWTRCGVQWSLALFCIVFAILLCRFHLVRAAAPVIKAVPQASGAAAAHVEDGAWRLYSAGLERLDASPNFPSIVHASNFGSGSPGWSEAADYLKQHRDAMELFVEGSKKPWLGRLDADAQRAGWLQEFRPKNSEQALVDIASLLTGAGHCAAEDHDWSFAARCFVAPIGIVRQVWAEQSPFRWQRINRLGDVDRAAQELTKLLAGHGAAIDEAALKCALEQLKSFDPDWRAEIVNCAHEQDRDLVTVCYSVDGRFTGDGFLKICELWPGTPKMKWFNTWLGRASSETETGTIVARHLLGPWLVPFIADRDEMLHKADRLNELIADELTVREAGGSDVGMSDRELDQLSETTFSQVRHLPLFVSNSRWIKSYMPRRMQAWRARNVVLTVVATELHQRQRGRWPESAAALVPEYLDSVPPDEFGRPLRLRVIDNRPVVYSLGLDNADNTAAIPTGQLRAVDDRDMQLFPPLPAVYGASR